MPLFENSKLGANIVLYFNTKIQPFHNCYPFSFSCVVLTNIYIEPVVPLCDIAEVLG